MAILTLVGTSKEVYYGAFIGVNWVFYFISGEGVSYTATHSLKDPGHHIWKQWRNQLLSPFCDRHHKFNRFSIKMEVVKKAATFHVDMAEAEYVAVEPVDALSLTLREWGYERKRRVNLWPI